MLAASVLSNSFNYLYQVTMGRLLTQVQYGELLALLSLFYMFSVVFATVNTSVTKFVSVYSARGQMELVRGLVRRATRVLLVAGLAVFLVVALLSPLVSSFLRIDSPVYLVILFASVPFGLVLPVYQGALRGLQRFISLGISTSSWSLFKLLFSVALVLAGYGLLGGVGGVFLAHVFAFLLTWYLLRDVLEGNAQDVPLGEILRYSWGAFLALFAYTALWNADMIVVKHYLPAETAGLYSAVSVLGKIALFAPGAIALVLFPEASKLHERGGNPLKVLLSAMLLSGLLSGAVVLLYALFPEEVVLLVYGAKYLNASKYLWKYALAMAFLALTSVVLNYALSIGRMAIGAALSLSLALEVAVLVAYHGSLGEVVLGLLLASGVTFITSLISLIPRGKNGI